MKYRSALFADDDVEYVEATKDYRLVYKGKLPKEAVLRTTRIAQDSRALHLELFTVPSHLTTFYRAFSLESLAFLLLPARWPFERHLEIQALSRSFKVVDSYERRQDISGGTGAK